MALMFLDLLAGVLLLLAAGTVLMGKMNRGLNAVVLVTAVATIVLNGKHLHHLQKIRNKKKRVPSPAKSVSVSDSDEEPVKEVPKDPPGDASSAIAALHAKVDKFSDDANEIKNLVKNSFGALTQEVQAVRDDVSEVKTTVKSQGKKL